MPNLTIGTDGQLVLPNNVRERYGLAPDTSVRLVETRGGILLIPQTGAPLSEELSSELEDWQALAAEVWSSFPYEAETP